MGNEINTFNGLGSSCSGSSGDIDRVLTLENTIKTSGDGFSVYLDGLILQLTTDYTLSHKTTGTTVTFLTEVWDDQEIIVNYYDEAYSMGVSGVSGAFSSKPIKLKVSGSFVEETMKVKVSGTFQ